MNDTKKIISDTKKYLNIVDLINQMENDIFSISQKIEYDEKFRKKYSNKILIENSLGNKDLKETIKFLKMDIDILNTKISSLNVNFEIYNQHVN